VLAELQSQLCPVPENIHTPPTEGIGISWREVHSLRPKHLKTEMYQGKGVSWIKSLLWGRDGYFQELSVLFSLMNFKIKLKTTKLNISAIFDRDNLVYLQYYTSLYSCIDFSSYTRL